MHSMREIIDEQYTEIASLNHSSAKTTDENPRVAQTSGEIRETRQELRQQQSPLSVQREDEGRGDTSHEIPTKEKQTQA